MRTINDFEKTKSFLEEKLVGTQLDSFRVYSLELQLNFLSSSVDGLQSCWLSITGNASFSDGKSNYDDHAQVIANLYALIGQKISAVKIEDENVLSLCSESKVLTICTDNESLEVVWSLTPESPDPYADHRWSVTLTDESILVLLT